MFLDIQNMGIMSALLLLSSMNFYTVSSHNRNEALGLFPMLTSGAALSKSICLVISQLFEKDPGPCER